MRPAFLTRLLGSAALLVAANAVPLVAALLGWMGVADVLVLYWLESVAVWAVTIVRVATAQGLPHHERRAVRHGYAADPGQRPADLGGAAFFAAHYGVFLAVHAGLLALFLHRLGAEPDPGVVGWTGAALALSHAGSLGVHWFAGGERWETEPTVAMWQPYPRMFVMHGTLGLGVGLVALLPGAGLQAAGTGLVALLVLAKTGVDLRFHLHEHLWRGRPRTERGNIRQGLRRSRWL